MYVIFVSDGLMNERIDELASYVAPLPSSSVVF
jgi:hypothetical protein